MSHQAAWINAKHARLEVGLADTPKPEQGEVLVKVKVIAFSPIESKLQRFEVRPISYPNILGQSLAGVIEDIGPGVSNFSVGDNVVVLRPGAKLSDHRFGAFQQYALASVESVSKLQPKTPLHDGASAILNLATVTSALSIYQGLERPVMTGDAQPKGQKVLIYGGSSSSGGLAINYARAAGYDVVSTSSPKNRSLVTSQGSNVVVIDHTQPAEKVVQDLHANGPYFRIFDTIGLPPVTNILTAYLSSAGGGIYHTLIPPLGGENPIPPNVQRKYEAYGQAFGKPEHKELRDWFYNELVTQGLASGKIKPTPPQWLAGGLEKTQRALDLMDQGLVSGAKLLIDPWSESR